MPLNTLLLIAVLFIPIVLLGLWIFRLETRLRNLMGGKNAKSLEDNMVNLKKEVEALSNSRKEIEDYLRSVERRLKKSIQAVTTVRFNPFKGTGSGGNQSFATAFMNENGDGVILSSLHGRDRMSMFAKPLEKAESPFELTAEEKEASVKAKESLKPTKKQ